MKTLAQLMLLLIVGINIQASYAEQKVIRIATEGAYKPWNYKDASGKLIGYELDLAADLCKRMQAKCEIVETAWDGIVPSLLSGKFDVIMAGMTITEKRKQVISFSAPYGGSKVVFFSSKDSPANAVDADYNLTSIEANEKAALEQLRGHLQGKSIGVQVSTIHEEFLKKYFSDEVSIKRYDTQENLDLDLEAGRIDYAIASMSYVVPLLNSEAGANYKLIGPVFSGDLYGPGVGAGIRKQDTKLIADFNQAIAAANADGSLEKMVQQWFGFDNRANE